MLFSNASESHYAALAKLLTFTDQDEGQTHNWEFAAILAHEYIFSFISLLAHIQPTEFYQLLLSSSSSVFKSAGAKG
jgi:hypothetical protein